MMTDSISRRDWQRLSAYIDGQLSAKESAFLATRLKNDPALQAALDDLKTLRGALRNLPQLRAPRNFTLTPQMARGRTPRAARLYPTFRLASVVLSLLFIFVLLGNIFGMGRLTIAPSAQELVAPAAEKMAEPVEMLAEAPAAQAITEGETGVAEDVESEPVAVPPEAESAAEAELASVTTATPELVIVEEESAPVMTIIPNVTSAPERAMPNSLAADSDIPQTSAMPLSRAAILEIVLAALALSTGSVALYLRWRSRR